MRQSSGNRNWTCDCCKDVSSLVFDKILDMKDVGVAIYRYLPQAENENQKDTVNGQVFILQNTGDGDVKLEELILESGKKKVSCPRCMKTIQHVKQLLKELPPVNKREVTGICDHCYQREFFNCPCCKKIVDKFLKFRLEETKHTEEERERNKSWLIKTHLSLKKSFSNVKDSKLEPTRPEGIRSEGRIHVSQIPTSRYIPTQKTAQEIVPFIEIYEKHRLQGKNEPINEEKKYQPAEDILEKPFILTKKPAQEPAPFLEMYEKHRLKGESETINEEKKYQLAENIIEKRFIPTKKTAQEPAAFLEMYEKLRLKGESEPINEEKKYQLAENMLEKPFIPTKKPAQERAPFLEMYEKHRPKGESEPTNEEKKHQLAEDILEKPLRVISFLDFPEEDIKREPKKEKKGILKSREDGAPGDVFDEKKKLPVSPPKHHSFETVLKSLSEPNVSDFSYSFPHEKFVIKKQIKRQISSSELIKYTQDMLKEREVEEKKKKADIQRLKKEKKTLAEAERKKREEEKEIKDKEAELEGESDEQDKTTKRKKRDNIAAGTIEDNEKPDSVYGLKKGGEDQVDKSEKLDKKDKSREGKQHDIAAMSALKEQVTKQAKEKSEEEKMRKQNEKNMALGEKQAREAEKTLEDREKQLTTEKKRKEAIPDIDDRIKNDGKDQDDKREKVDKKDKGREEKQQDHATSALKDQVAKQAKEKSEEERLRKQQERDVALAEKKAKDAQKAIEDKEKHLTTEKIKIPTEVKNEKDDKGKGEKLEKPIKEQKAKDDTRGEMAALLKEQLAKQKQQELEKEKLRKEQQKERELAEKKLKELQTKKEEKEPAIKPPIILLKPDDISDDEDVFEDILKLQQVTDMIKGQKIYKVKSMKRAAEKQLILESKQSDEPKKKTDKEEPEILKPYAEPSAKQLKQFSEHKSMISESAQKEKKLKPPDPDASKGVIRYTLSDRSFIDKGWTMLPTEKVVRKMNVYRMRPAKPEFDWFEHNKYKREMTYDSGEKLAEFDDNGRGRWYYRSGELALDYYDAEETNAGQRFVVYSTGQPDERGRSRPRTILATFDYSGNGIVFDHTGKIRLKYNQTEGVVLDRTIGPVSHWKWHTLNDPPVLQQVMIDTQMPYKDPTILKMGDKNADQKRPDNEEMIAIEFENFLKEKRQKLTQSFKPFQIKMKAMKINENFSVRVLDQASVYLLFRDGTTNLKINLGMVLDHKEIVDTDTAEIGEVSNTLDKLPACTDSIAGLQKAVAQAQAAERTRVRHERRLKQPHETASVDALRAGCSRPPRTPILQTSLTSCEKMTPKRFKPSCCDLYYSTQLY